MSNHPRPTRRLTLGATLLATLALVVAGATPASAETIGSGEASAYGATISAGGQEVIPPTPTAAVSLPPGGEASDAVVDVPADPVAVSGTLNADAVAHAEADVDSALTVVSQEVEGPYNASGVGLIEGAEVLVDVVGEDVSLLSAAAIRAEAVAVCRGGAVEYAANSEIIGLNVGGEDVPLNGPVSDLLDAVNDLLEQTTLNQVVDIQRNVVTPTADGIAVDALVVTVLQAVEGQVGAPLAEVRLGHAEVRGVACGGDLPECSDGEDNDGDGLIDHPDDPGCDSPEDDSELDEPTDLPDDGQVTTALPRTGSNDAATVGLAALMGGGALGLLALRRRLLA